MNIRHTKFSISVVFLSLFVQCGGDTTSSNNENDASSSTIKTHFSQGPDGMAVFRQRCVTCHGVDGQLGLSGAKNLARSVLDTAQRINIVKNGKGLMTPFGAVLSEAEIAAVARYTFTLKQAQ
jgi:cytochrome c6